MFTLLPILLAGCAPEDDTGKPVKDDTGDPKDSGHTGDTSDSGHTGDAGDSGDSGDTGETSVHYSDIAADYEKDGDYFLDDSTPETILSQLLSGDILDTPKSVLNNLAMGLKDCNDDEETINPLADEVCDEVDNNCDGEIDEGVTNTYYRDSDEDGHGTLDEQIQACETPEGYSELYDDCDDGNSEVFTGTKFYVDADEDGFGDLETYECESEIKPGLSDIDGDCDDDNEAINPDATEVCDEVDNNCDGEVDEGVTSLFYRDADGDGYGDPAISDLRCTTGDGYVADDTDCNDSEAAIHENQIYFVDADYDGVGGSSTEAMCEVDAPFGYSETTGDCNDDDGSVTEEQVYHLDSDYDGFGSTETEFVCAADAPFGYSENSDDCDDDNESINPDATEVCDDLDNNCDGEIDNGLETYTFYADSDEDGYGDPDVWEETCYTSLSGYVANDTDCDDSEAGIHTLIDYHIDADGDTWGTSETEPFCSLTAPEGFADRNNDCDDTNSATYPGATEVCDEVDNDCDDEIDEGVTTTAYTDADGDGYGDESATSVEVCSIESGFSANNLDCNDTNIDVNPGAEEIANNDLDDDCDPDTVIQLEGEYSLADAPFQGSATTSEAYDGYSLASADINGDSYDELLVGAPQVAETSAGGIYVLYGSDSGLLPSSYAYLGGENNGDLTGFAVVNAGDVDGDGVEDLLVGAPKHDAGGTDAGAVFLVSGTGVSTGNLADVALSVFVGEGSYNDAGIAVAGIQDQDGDGLNEVAIGASGYLNSSDAFGNGAVYIFSGSDLEEELDLADASVKIVGESFYDIAGSAIDSGDVDGDGIADLAMSSLNSHEAGVSSSIGAGRADVFFGELDSDVLTTDESDVTILGESGGDRLGNAISVAGDLDFDGYNDLVTCAELEDTYGERTGSCYLFLSSAISFSGVLQAGEDESIKLVGYESGAHLGSAVTIGNINGDSYDDLVVGENGEGLSSHSSHIGGAYVLYGPLEEMGTADMTDVADVFLQGENRTDYAGTGITTGDYNADNKSDLSIGAPGYDDFGRSNTGRDYTFYGLGE